MQLAAERLIDWKTARTVGARVAGGGPEMSPADRARIREDFAELVPQAEDLVASFTGLGPGSGSSRSWVMTRQEWVGANLRAFERLLDPLAERLLPTRSDGSLAGVRRAALGVQVGALLGYLGRRVLGQYDLFLPPDDAGLLYFVGPNVVGVERKYRFPTREFRLWLSLHEVAHRVQFGGVPWLRGHIGGLIDSYLSTIDLDPKRLVESLRRAVEEVRKGDAEWRGLGWIFLVMSPDQRQMFRKMQAVMTLLEGHGNFVMDAVARPRIRGVSTFKRRLHERRRKAGIERVFQKAIGLDAKVRQYDAGERFVAEVVDVVGMEGFNRVWEDASKLPTLEEVGRPDAWVARVARG
jgi:coenzyme F420 biosynthesis associated uncharacterized protein